MNQLGIFTKTTGANHKQNMVKIVIRGGGTQNLLDNREKIIEKRYGSSLKLEWL